MYFGEKEFSALHDSRIWDAYQANTLSIYKSGGMKNVPALSWIGLSGCG